MNIAQLARLIFQLTRKATPRLQHTREWRWSLCLTVVSGLWLLVPRTTNAETRCGFSRVDITPPVGFRIAGNYFESFSQSVHDPLHGRVLYVDDRETQAFVISLDVCSIGKVASDPIRKSIEEATGVAFSNIILSATHNHAGPEYYGTLRDYFHEKALREKGVDPGEPVDFTKLLVKRLTQACVEAKTKSVPARFEFGETIVEGVAFNRRFHMKDGSVRMNPGFGNPNMVRVAGPIDPRLPVLFVRSLESNRPIGMYTTFPMHTATYGDLTKIGADFPGVLDQRMRDKFGDEFVTLFGEGTAGDINHLDFSNGKSPDRWSVYQVIGNRLADAIETLIPNMKPIQVPSVRMAHVIEPIALQAVDADAFQKAPEILFAAKGERSFLERVGAWKEMNTQRLLKRDGDHLQAELQALAIGDHREFALVSLPHEVFVELGMMIREGSPFPITAVVTLAQDLDFYVPTKKAFAEGSYEVTTSSIQPGGGEQMARAAIALLKQLVPEDH